VSAASASKNRKHRFADRNNSHRLMHTYGEQGLIAGDEEIGICSERSANDDIIIRIRREPRNRCWQHERDHFSVQVYQLVNGQR
jgi:hypothetical protein